MPSEIHDDPDPVTGPVATATGRRAETGERNYAATNAIRELVWAASAGHGDVLLVRQVILSLDRAWVVERVLPEIDQVLARSATEEEYRRFAELLMDVDPGVLRALLDRAAVSEDAEIRQVAEDFADVAS